MHNKDKFGINTILESIDKIFNYSRPYKNSDDFYNSPKEFDASMMNFIIIGEMAVRLSEDFKEKHCNIDWFKIKGFRNIVAHDYFGIDAEEVWDIIQKHLPQLQIDLSSIRI